MVPGMGDDKEERAAWKKHEGGHEPDVGDRKKVLTGNVMMLVAMLR